MRLGRSKILSITTFLQLSPILEFAVVFFLNQILTIPKPEISQLHSIQVILDLVNFFQTFSYLAKDFMDIHPGARNGVKNGITFLIDVEDFEYSFFPRSGKGFSVALADARDRPIVRQQGKQTKSFKSIKIPKFDVSVVFLF